MVRTEPPTSHTSGARLRPIASSIVRARDLAESQVIPSSTDHPCTYTSATGPGRCISSYRRLPGARADTPRHLPCGPQDLNCSRKEFLHNALQLQPSGRATGEMRYRSRRADTNAASARPGSGRHASSRLGGSRRSEGFHRAARCSSRSEEERSDVTTGPRRCAGVTGSRW